MLGFAAVRLGHPHCGVSQQLLLTFGAVRENPSSLRAFSANRSSLRRFSASGLLTAAFSSKRVLTATILSKKLLALAAERTVLLKNAAVRLGVPHSGDSQQTCPSQRAFWASASHTTRDSSNARSIASRKLRRCSPFPQDQRRHSAREVAAFRFCPLHCAARRQK